MNKRFLGVVLLCLSFSPLNAQLGSINSEYTEYGKTVGEHRRVIFASNTKTGKSVRYFFDGDNYKKSTTQLPGNLLDGESSEIGEIMTEYIEYGKTVGEHRRVIFAWNTKTGKSVRYFFDGENYKKSTTQLPENLLDGESTEVGEIMVKYIEYGATVGEHRRVIFAWNTKTGKSVRYFYDGENYKKSSTQLPNNLFDGESTEAGEIMMEYTEYGKTVGAHRRVIFAWNTKTGKSIRYFYDGENYKKSTTQLPNNLLDGESTEVGEIMAEYTEYGATVGEHRRVIFAWNTKTGKSVRYFFDGDNYKKSAVQLPNNLLDGESTEAGEIMTEYTEYGKTVGEHRRVIFAWNTKTGKSVRYFYDGENYKKSSTQLPHNLLYGE